MKEIKVFSESDIPYDVLEKFGIPKDAVEDFPENVMRRFLSGKSTPVMPVYYITERGERIRSFSRLVLTTTENGETDILFIPRWKTSELEDYNLIDRSKLLDGLVITADLPLKGFCYVQFNDTINQVISVPQEIIRHNLNILKNNSVITAQDMEIIQEGAPLMLQQDREEYNVTIGIDLREDYGIRFTKGDLQKWRADKNEEDLPKYSFGQNGCWASDMNGHLSYFREEDFTPEMTAEKERLTKANAANANVRQQMRMTP